MELQHFLTMYITLNKVDETVVAMSYKVAVLAKKTNEEEEDEENV